ncbi:hypothetical protein [Psychromonas arctica]|uniref:hypothetical protein n=1 Tax=Psychromonas arctica TaxID=168275 RepID=UPI002FD1A47B
MQCIDSSFITSMIWSFFLVLAIAQLRCDGHIKSFLQELYGPPILMALVISGIFMFFTYESLPLPKTQTIGTLLNRPAHFIESLMCNFNTVFNVLGIILPFITIYSFLKEHYPDVLKDIKEKLGMD